MAKKLLIAGMLAAVGVIYYYQYRDHIPRSDIELAVTMRPKFIAGTPVPGADGQPADMVIFTLGQEYKLNSLKVMALSDAAQKNPHALWDLVSESNSVPIIDFEYGKKIPGMHPRIKGGKVEPLLPNTDYRIFVQAKSLKGFHDFHTRGEAAAE